MKGYTVLLIIIAVGCLLKLRPLRNYFKWLISARYRSDKRRLKELLGDKARLQSRLNKVMDEIRGLK